MMVKYTNIETILGKVSRKVKDFNELDAIEDAVEALNFLYIPGAMQQVVSFQEVKNFTSDVPRDLSRLIQIAKDNRYNNLQDSYCPSDNLAEDNTCIIDIPTNCDSDCPEIRFSALSTAIEMDFKLFTTFAFKKRNFSPVRLTTAKFFGTSIYEDFNRNIKSRYEYTVIDGKQFRFNFREGYIAVSYERIPVGSNGLPLVPDIPEVINAVTYYIMWQIAERNMWAGREGFSQLTQ